MRRIRAKNTSPEMAVRSVAHRLGYRYRLHDGGLPGKPDLVFPRLGKIIEVRGCFWHGHPGCIDFHVPKSRRSYWGPKLLRNRQRDKVNERKLRSLGWRVLTIWECETSAARNLRRLVSRFLRD